MLCHCVDGITGNGEICIKLSTTFNYYLINILVRVHRHRRLRVRRHGELGPCHLQGELRPGGPGQHVLGQQTVGRHRRRPRDGAPVVRKPRHHGMVKLLAFT